MLGCLALGMKRSEVKKKFRQIVRFSEIGDAVYLPMSTYSSGMGARLRFAISTAVVPDILVVDEALATGDAAFREKCERRITAIRESAGTVFIVSHSAKTISEMCTRAIWLDKGEIRMDGDVDEVAEAYRKHVLELRREKRRKRMERRARRAAEAEKWESGKV